MKPAGFALSRLRPRLWSSYILDDLFILPGDYFVGGFTHEPRVGNGL